jgi:dipeptidyl-peptidase-4
MWCKISKVHVRENTNMSHSRKCKFPIAILFAIIGALSVSAPRAAAQTPQSPGKQLTIETIFGQPGLNGRPTPGLAWVPDGKSVSYFHLDSGSGKSMRELWAMDAASGQTHVLVSAEKLETLLEPPKGKPSQKTGLGRHPPSSYFWAPDSKALLFAGEDQLVWLDLQTMASRVLIHSASEIQDPKISPDGKLVSYLENHDLWVVPTAGGNSKQITTGGTTALLHGELDWVYPEELDLGTAYWWSPDSKSIAYLQMDESPVNKYPLVDLQSYTGTTEFERYPNAGDPNPVVRVGVAGADGGESIWMDTGADDQVYLARVAWTPDSRQVAIQRLTRSQKRLDLLMADAASGKSSVLLTEQDPYWINMSDDLRFLKNSDRFIWSSERSGFRHLYLYSREGKLLSQLTRGDWVVTGLEGVDEAGGYVYYTSSQKSPIESHLYRVALTGGQPQQLTHQDGSHFPILAPNANGWIDHYTNAMQPVRTDLYSADGHLVATINENKIPQLADYNLSPVKFLTVDADDGTKLWASIIKPPDFDPAKKYPVILDIYGGPGVQTVRDAWGGATFLWEQMMAQKGYIIFSLDNRGMSGRGHAFETPIYHHFGKVELQDQLAGVRYLKSQPWVDDSRIGFTGWSYGGYMTLTAMFNAAGVFKAAFAGAPVTDWRQYDTIYTERYMGTPKENPGGYADSSPVNHAANLQGKLLIAHGTGDDNVHFSNTVELEEKLIDADKYAEIALYPGRGHGITDPPARIQLFQRVTRFFLDNL